jgi:16S rRNA (guanine527-N7)-methyltransferase
MGLSFEPAEIERLGRFLAMLLEANRVANLTAIVHPEEAWERHILDSLTLLPLLAELPPGARVLDLGTGGGLPGVPLALCMPALSFTLVDATEKKTRIVRASVEALGLSNADVVAGRAEALGHVLGCKVGNERTGAFREAFDAVVSRAVGRLATLSELAVPFAKVGGLCLLIKGAKADEELAEAKGALHLLHAAHAGTVETPTGRIVVIEKLRATPRDYPRRDGEPKRSPLGVVSAPAERRADRVRPDDDGADG